MPVFNKIDLPRAFALIFSMPCNICRLHTRQRKEMYRRCGLAVKYADSYHRCCQFDCSMCSNKNAIGEGGNGKQPHNIHFPRKNPKPCIWFLLSSKSSMCRSFFKPKYLILLCYIYCAYCTNILFLIYAVYQCIFMAMLHNPCFLCI